MKTLAEFDTLEAAKAYSYTQGKLIPRTTMNSLLGDAGLMLAFEQEALVDDRFAAFMHPTSTEYNFIVGDGTTTGDRQIDMLDDIIQEGKFPALASLKPIVLHIGNPVTYPYANATHHAFLKAKGTCPTKQVSPVNGYLKITLTQDVEAHRPSVHAIIDGVVTYITTFSEVSSVKSYNCQVPRGYTEFYVDEAYGAIA